MRNKTDSKVIMALAKRAFPSWRGRKLYVQISDRPRSLASYWDGGSKDSFTVLHLKDGAVVRTSTPPAMAPFGPKVEPYIPNPDEILVEHSIFLGKDGGCTVYLHPENSFAKSKPEG